MYNLNLYRLAMLITPTFLRRTRMQAWLSSLLTPLQLLHDYGFMPNRQHDLFRIGISSSVCRLEYLLNATFYRPGLDTAYNRRIIIQQQSSINSLAIYLNGITQPNDEEKPIYLGEYYIYTAAETGQGSVDFTVYVPYEVPSFSMVRFVELLRAYCLPDKTFNVVNY